MEKPTIKKGKLTEKKLIELYGSEAQKNLTQKKTPERLRK